MVAFAGERVLELEAPIRNDLTKEILAGWGRTQDEVEGGRRRLEPAMVRECFEYLFSKVNYATQQEQANRGDRRKRDKRPSLTNMADGGEEGHWEWDRMTEETIQHAQRLREQTRSVVGGWLLSARS